MKPGSAAAVCVLLVTAIGCFPYHGASQLPIPTTPVVFKDAATGEPLERVLILPKYISSTGLGTGAGHGPGGGIERCYLAHPFVYKRGEPFMPRPPKVTGIVWGLGWAVIGRGVSIEGATVVAPGYRSRQILYIWEASDRPIALTPLPQPDADLEVEKMWRLLQRSRLAGAEAEPFALCDRIGVRFSRRERVMIQEFLSGGRSSSGHVPR